MDELMDELWCGIWKGVDGVVECILYPHFTGYFFYYAHIYDIPSMTCIEYSALCFPCFSIRFVNDGFLASWVQVTCLVVEVTFAPSSRFASIMVRYICRLSPLALFRGFSH